MPLRTQYGKRQKLKFAVAYCSYQLLGLLVDSVDSLMTFLRIVPSERPRSDHDQPSDVDGLSDDEIIHLPEPPELAASGAPISFQSGVHRWTVGTVLKCIRYSGARGRAESRAMELVFHHTTIPIPRVRRIIDEHDCLNIHGYIIMDYIPGRTLKEAWPTMSFFAKLRVAFVLRRYIRQLRSIRHPRTAVPGPMGPGLEALRGHSPLYGPINDTLGPFSSYAEYAAFWNERHAYGMTPHNATPEEEAAIAASLIPFDDSAPLVFTHNDLAMRNIIVGDDGRLWLIDWGFAGFYPPWFEFVNLRLSWLCEKARERRRDWLWDLCIPFICGPYHWQEWWYEYMGPGLMLR
ncbi:kinase-like domain-containing protein [Trametes elegans]|nr:kinase-like domain-containing protein [Trametes elegans]